MPKRLKKAVIANGDDENTMSSLEGIRKELITFGFDRKNDYSAEIISRKGLCTRFDLYVRGERQGGYEIHVPGDHNVLNALAAAAAASCCGVSYEGNSSGA